MAPRARSPAATVSDLPFIVVLIGLSGLAMLMPAGYAAATGEREIAATFAFCAALSLVLFGLTALATKGMRIRRQGRGQLLSLIASYATLPLVLALPLAEATSGARFVDGWIEMVSCLTTTGATFFDPEVLPFPLHLWRAWIGWLGGFFVWVTAVAIFAPLNLGGYEIGSEQEVGRGALTGTSIAAVTPPPERLRRYGARLLPIYVVLTFVLWMALILAGDRPGTAAITAMATLSTSGITPLGPVAEDGGAAGPTAGLTGEVLVFIFLIFALSRLTFASDERRQGATPLWEDPELRLGLLFCVMIPGALLLRHYLFGVEGADFGLIPGLEAFWGAIFTVASFLTTAGFVSEVWDSSKAWAGLPTPGLLLIGLALMGGGVATTAGGIKLLRIYALYKHGLREMEKLVRPNSVGGAGQVARRFRRKGAYVAWIFFMLFVVSIAAVSLLFTLLGESFEAALVLTVAALTTTGPLTEVALPDPIAMAELGDAAKVVFGAAMIIGRLETLVIIAVLNPDFWRG